MPVPQRLGEANALNISFPRDISSSENYWNSSFSNGRIFFLVGRGQNQSLIYARLSALPLSSILILIFINVSQASEAVPFLGKNLNFHSHWAELVTL